LSAQRRSSILDYRLAALRPAALISVNGTEARRFRINGNPGSRVSAVRQAPAGRRLHPGRQLSL